MTSYRDGYDFRKWYAASSRNGRVGTGSAGAGRGEHRRAHGNGVVRANDHPPLFLSCLPGFFIGFRPLPETAGLPTRT